MKFNQVYSVQFGMQSLQQLIVPNKGSFEPQIRLMGDRVGGLMFI